MLISKEWTYCESVGIALHGTLYFGNSDLESAVVRGDAASRRAGLGGDRRCDSLAGDEGRDQAEHEDGGRKHGVGGSGNCRGSESDKERMVLPMKEQASGKKEECDVWLQWESVADV